jgi:hypothetical protein
MKKILFVCLGNICRSPLAEYMMRDTAAKRGLMLETASAGTSGWHDGEGMHCGSADILDGLGIASNGFTSRRVCESDLDEFDYIMVMDDSNLADMQERFGRRPQQIFKITDLVGNRPYDHIPDPWFTRNFTQTRDLLAACCEEIADRLQDGRL